jgi:hypothetical protein
MRHLMTLKHKELSPFFDKSSPFFDRDSEPDYGKTINKYTYNCNNCSKMYKTPQGLWCHSKKCISNTENMLLYDNNKKMKKSEDSSEKELTTDKYILEYLKKSSDFQEFIAEQTNEMRNIIVEQNEKIIELSKKESIVYNTTNNTTNNNNIVNSNNSNSNNSNTMNNHLNINLFLNEKCKDALNIDDFVNSLKMDFSDLEYLGANGYAEGISNILLKGLKGLDVYKRPIHCTDIKRETFYVKDEDIWEKDDDENKKVKKVIDKVSRNNMKNVITWKNSTPECDVVNSNAYNFHINIMKQSLNGGTKEKVEKNENKIRKNLAKSVFIHKNSREQITNNK